VADKPSEQGQVCMGGAPRLKYYKFEWRDLIILTRKATEKIVVHNSRMEAYAYSFSFSIQLMGFSLNTPAKC
jgi:hypothetical protein